MKRIWILFLVFALSACGAVPPQNRGPVAAPIAPQTVVTKSMTFIDYAVSAEGKISMVEWETTSTGEKKIIRSGESCPKTNAAVVAAVDCRVIREFEIRVEKPLFSSKLEVYISGAP